MHDVQHKKPSLVVLDDPVSSFDKTKKFAILHQLFHGKNSLRGVTSLLLTHDIAAIDIVLTTGQFAAPGRSSTSLADGRGFCPRSLSSRLISRRSPRFARRTYLPRQIRSSSASICAVDSRSMVRVEMNMNCFQVCSMLGDLPTRKLTTGELVPLDSSEVLATTEAVRKYIRAFDYHQLVTDLKKPGALKARFDTTTVGYEKVQLLGSCWR